MKSRNLPDLGYNTSDFILISSIPFILNESVIKEAATVFTRRTNVKDNTDLWFRCRPFIWKSEVLCFSGDQLNLYIPIDVLKEFISNQISSFLGEDFLKELQFLRDFSKEDYFSESDSKVCLGDLKIFNYDKICFWDGNNWVKTKPINPYGFDLREDLPSFGDNSFLLGSTCFRGVAPDEMFYWGVNNAIK